MSGALLLSGAPAAAQSTAADWTVDRVVAEALERSAAVRSARLEASAAAAEARARRGSLLPGFGVEAGVMRSTDPVAAFGTKLRQGRFSAEDLALDALNQPDAVSDWNVALAGQWSVLSPTRWSEYRAASHRAEGGALRAEVVERDIELVARTLFHQAVAAEARVVAIEADLAAKAEGLDVMRSRFEQGVLTEADTLGARAELEATNAMAGIVRDQRDDVRTELALLLGRAPEELGGLAPSPLPATAPAAPDFSPDRRPDVVMAAEFAAAADAQVSAARRSRLPTLNAYGAVGRYAESLSGAAEDSWTVGLSLSVPLFTGFSLGSRVEASARAADAERIRLEDARRRAASDHRAAQRDVEVAFAALTSARLASDAAREAARLTRLRFEEGLTTTLDLLTSQARNASLEASAVDAESRYRIALARLAWASTESES